MLVREILSKTILTKTGIEGYDYCINPYVGCGHGCSYCYAGFMKRFTGHMEAWGEFVDIKTNAPALLKKQLQKRNKGSLLIGTVTDPYQPVERRYRITRHCLEALLQADFSLSMLTRSPLIVRDIDILSQFSEIEVGMSIATDDEKIMRNFEKNSPAISARAGALKKLHRAGINTYAFIGPLLPLNAKKIVQMLSGTVNSVLIDRLNYSYKVVSLYRKLNLEAYLEQRYFTETGIELKERFEHLGIPAHVLYSA